MKNLITVLAALLFSYGAYAQYPIGGTLGACTGATSVLYDATAGGTWASSDPTIVTIDTFSGAAVGVASGIATITYTSGSSYVTADFQVSSTPGSISGSTAVCVGATTPLSNSVSGGTWTSDAVSYAAIDPTTGSVTGISAGTANISYTMGVGCSVGTAFSVNPLASVDPVASQALCNGSATSAINFTGNLSTSLYSWTNDNTAIGLGASGNGNISSFTATNSSSSPITANLSVTASAAGCSDVSQNFTITVYPTPNVNSVSSQSICAGALSSAVTLTGAVAGTTFNWSNSNATIGLSATGSGNISSFTAINTGTSPVVSTITVTPSANGCSGTAGTFTITANPLPEVNPVSSQVLCSGAATTDINFTGNVSTSTYHWTNDQPSIGIAASGSGNILSFTASNNTSATITAHLSVTASSAGCSDLSQSFTITVYPAPTVDAIANQALCLGASTNLVSFSGMVPGTTYNWTASDATIGIASSGSGDIASFTAVNSGTSPVISTIVVTPTANGCTGTTGNFTITVNPLPEVDPVSSQFVCNGAGTTDIVFTGNVSTATYNWTNTNSAIGIGASGTGNILSFTATNGSSAPITASLSVTASVSGCSGAAQNFSMTVYPTPTVDAITSQTLCNATSTTPVSFTGLVTGTTFNWTASDATIGISATGSGDIASFTATNSGFAPVLSTIAVTPVANGCTGVSQSFGITVNPTPVVTMPSDQIVCNGASTADINFSSTESGTTFSWTNTYSSIGIGASGSGNISSFTALNSSFVPVNALLTVTPSALGCTGSSNTMNITVNPTPDVAPVSNQTVCANVASSAVNFTGDVTATTFSWTNSNTSIGLGASGSGNLSSFTATNAGITSINGTITVTPTASGCPGIPQNFTINVNPAPAVAAVSDQSVCNGLASTTASFTSALSGTTFTWTNSNTSIGLGASGSGNIASFTATNGGTAAITGLITVTPTSSIGCVGTNGSFSINVNPTPTVAAVSSQTVCNGTGTSAVTFAGTVTGTVFGWTNNTTGIGLGAAGTGTIGAFIASNASTAPVTANIAVTPVASACTGLPINFNITVNPTPTADPVASQVICNGNPTTGVNFTGPVSGTTFSWTNNNSTIGLAASGAGNIASFSATNGGSTQISGAISVTPSANGCAGPINGFAITVNPTPILATPANQTVCNGAVTSAVNFSGLVTGTTYSWTNSNIAIGLAASGTGAVPSFTASNATYSAEAGTISVTPTAAGCVGTTQNFTINVNPTPTVSAPSDQSICNGTSSAAVVFTGAVSGSTFAWVNSNTGIGLGAGGTGNISSFTSVNLGLTASSGSIVVTPSASGCTGLAQTFMITVNPTPAMSSVANQLVCNGLTTAPVNFTGTLSGTIFNWSNSDPTIGLPASGTGNIPSFAGLNSTVSMEIATVTVTPSTVSGCTGSDESFVIAVNPTPDVSATASQVLCSGAITDPVLFTGSVSGTTFPWTNSNATIGLATSGTSNIASFTASNHSALPVTSVITVTPMTSGCAGTPQSFTITVNPVPTITTIANQTKCNGAPTTAVVFSSSLSGTSINWTNTNTSIGLGASGTGNIASFITTNGSNVPQTGAINVTSAAGGCAGVPRAFTIKVNPTPDINDLADQDLCSGAITSAIAFSGTVSGTTYSWTNNYPGIGIATSGSGNVAPFIAYNSGSSVITNTLTAIPAANGCTGHSKEVLITVNPIPTVILPASQSLCNGATTAAVSFSGSVSGASYSWINTNPSVGLSASGTGDIAAFLATNSTSSNEVSTIMVLPSAGGCTGTARSFNITVKPTPDVLPIGDQSLCNGSATAIVTFSGSVSGSTYSWTNSNTATGLRATGSGNIAAFMATNTSTAPIASFVTVTPTASGCTGASQSFSIIVNPAPNVISIANQTVCNGNSTADILFSGAVSGTTFNWTNTNTTIGLASSGSGEIVPFAVTNAGTSASTAAITVAPSANGCTGSPKNFTITVNPTPVMTAVSNQVLCNGARTTSVGFTGSVSGTTFHWTNTNTAIGLASSGTGNIASFTGVNTGTAPSIGLITITPTAAGCTGTAENMNITVNPTPGVASIPNEALCNGAVSPAISFTNTFSGVTNSWVNSNPGIGLAASGSGTVPAFTATNGSSAATLGVISITPSAAGCTGAVQHFQITVNPTPNVVVPANQTICNGASSAAASFTGAVSGTTYSWSNNNTGVGLGATGTGTIASFTGIDGSLIPDTATITVTPATSTCSGAAQSFWIAVNPIPSVSVPADQTVCNGASTAAVSFTGTLTSAVYSWTNSNTGIGLGASGTGNIGSFAAANTSLSLASTAMITVTPAAGGCIGAPQHFNLTVNPTPTVTTPASQVVCNGLATTPVSFSGPVSGTTFAWANSNPAVGLSSLGAGNISSFTATNSSNIAVNAVITVTPSANGCLGVPANFEVTVNPTPVMASLSNQALCNGQLTNPVGFSSSVTGTTYSWSNANPTMGLGGSGTGNIPAFTALNTTTVPETTIVTITPIASRCIGAAQTFAITVNPTPDVMIPANQVFCNGAATNPVYFTGTVAGATYSWTNDNTAIGLAASGTGNISSFIATDNTASSFTATIKVTPNAYGCQGAMQNFTIGVNPNPVAATIATKSPSSVCANTQLQTFGTGTTAPAGMEYTWSVANATLWQVGAGNQYALVSFPNPGSSLVTLTTTNTATNCMSKTTYNVNVNESTADQPALTYSNGNFALVNYVADSYVWGYDDVATLEPTILAGQSSATYYDPNPDFVGKFYWVMTTKGGCSQKSYYILPTTGVNNVPSQNAFHMEIYPNPVENELNVKISGADVDGMEARIFDMTGKLVMTMPMTEAKTTVAMDKIATGVYSLGCYKNGARIASGTFVKQ